MLLLMKKHLAPLKKLIELLDINLIQKIEEKGSLMNEKERNMIVKDTQDNIQTIHYPYFYQGVGKYFVRFLKLLEYDQNSIGASLKDIVGQASDPNLLRNMYIGWNYAL